MAVTATKIEEIINHHLEALAANNLPELLQDYSEQSEVWTPDGILAGLDAISTFYTRIFAILPKGETTLNINQMIIVENKAYLVWSAGSSVVDIPLGTDSFEIKQGKIIWQSLAAQIIPK